MSIRSKIAALACFTVFLTPAITVHPSIAGEITICNTSKEPKRVSLVYQTGVGVLFDSWTAAGRYLIEGGACDTYFEGSTSVIRAYVNVLVPGPDGELSDGVYEGTEKRTGAITFQYGDWHYCMNPNGGFEIKGSARQLQICRPGTEKRLFGIFVWADTNARATLSLD